MLADDLRAWLADPTPPQLPLPEVEAPPLHGLRVSVPPLPDALDLTADRLMEIYVERVRGLAPSRTLAPGEFARRGDLVQVDMVFIANEGAITRTAAARQWLVAGEPWVVPGIGEGLVGTTPLEIVDLPTAFPPDYPVPWLRGVPGHYRVRIRAIEALREPDPEAPGFYEQLGLDLSIEAFMEALRDDYIETLTRQLEATAANEVLDLLRGRSPVEIPGPLIEAEIFREWAEKEGVVMLELGSGEADLNLAFATWLRDAEIREQVRRRLHIGLLLGAIAKRDGLQLTEAELEKRLEEVAMPFGLDAEEARQSIREEPVWARRFTQDAFYLMCVEHVVDQAKITYRQPT